MPRDTENQKCEIRAKMQNNSLHLALSRVFGTFNVMVTVAERQSCE